MRPSCRNCARAYLRTEKTRHYNYEACGVGAQTMMPYLDGLCSHYKPMTEEKQREVLHIHPEIFYGVPIEL